MKKKNNVSREEFGASNEYMTKAEAAEYTRHSARKLDQEKAEGRLAHFMCGPRKCLFKKSDLDQWLCSFRVEHK